MVRVLTLPPGYTRLVPLDRLRHAGHGVGGSGRFGFARGLNAIPLTLPELSVAARHYPVVLTRTGSGPWLPVCVTSYAAGSNDFVDARGAWRPGVYVPAYVRRFPFLVVPVRRAGSEDDGDGESTGSVICVDEGGLSADAEPLFDARGEPTPAWPPIETLIRELKGAEEATRRFTSRLEGLGLLAPFEAHAQHDAGPPHRLAGMHRVMEERLDALPGDTVKALMAEGYLSRIYAHLASLENFASLLEGGPQGTSA